MDEIEITLPESGKIVTLRNYTTHKDDDLSEEVLYRGVNTVSSEAKQETKFPLANVMDSLKVYVRRLVLSIDGDNKNISYRLDELRSKDYDAIQEAVDKIVEENSPKAPKVNSGSKDSSLKTETNTQSL